MSVAAKTREDTASVTGEHKFLSEDQGICVSKNLDEAVHLLSEKREKWIREIRKRL